MNGATRLLLSHKSRCVCLFVAVCAVSVILDIRPSAKTGEQFIGHADEANMAMVARNIAEGRGAVTDCVWLLHGGGRPGHDVCQPEGYWSIYVAALIAPFFKLFGACRESMLLAASLAKTGIAAWGFYWVQRFTGRGLPAAVCGITLLFCPQVLRCVNGLSDIYLALAIGLALSAMIWAIERGSGGWWFLAGLLAGVAIGVKPSGMILLGVMPLCVTFSRRFRGALGSGWAYLPGLVLAVAPLACHNYRANGSLWWPDAPLMHSALRQMNASRGSSSSAWTAVGDAWASAAYDPTAARQAVPFLSRTWCALHARNLVGFATAFGRGEIAPLWLLPFAFCSLVEWLRRWWQTRRGGNTLEDLFVCAALWLACGALGLGAAVHTENRYFVFLLPVFVVLGIVVCSRYAPFLVFALLFSIVCGLGYYAATAERTTGTRRVAAYETVSVLLPQQTVVMTQNPWEFSFHTRRQSVMLPYCSTESLIRDIAERYRVEYLVIINREVRHPGLQQFNEGKFPPFLKKLYQTDGLIVARFNDYPTPSCCNN